MMMTRRRRMTMATNDDKESYLGSCCCLGLFCVCHKMNSPPLSLCIFPLTLFFISLFFVEPPSPSSFSPDGFFLRHLSFILCSPRWAPSTHKRVFFFSAWGLFAYYGYALFCDIFAGLATQHGDSGSRSANWNILPYLRPHTILQTCLSSDGKSCI